MQTHAPGCLCHSQVNIVPRRPETPRREEESCRLAPVQSLPNSEPSPEDERTFVINKYGPVGPLCRGFEPDLVLNEINIGYIKADQFISPNAGFG